METCTESSANPMYMFFGLQAEVGEVMDKIAKAIRKGKLKIDNNEFVYLGSDDEADKFVDDLRMEVADCLWFIAGIHKTMNWHLQGTANMLIGKLQSRKERGVIIGDGDNR